MTLDEFLAESWPVAWVVEPGFARLYVRKNRRHLDGRPHDVLDLASLDAEIPGNGAFSRLIARLHPDHHLYVETVLSKRFAAHLERNGFQRDMRHPFDRCYYLLREARS